MTTYAIPVLTCRDCRSQVCLTDAVGRSTMPTFQVAGTRDLLCLFCARQQDDPGQLVALRTDEASWVPGSQTRPDAESLALLVSLGAREVA